MSQLSLCVGIGRSATGDLGVVSRLDWLTPRRLFAISAGCDDEPFHLKTKAVASSNARALVMRPRIDRSHHSNKLVELKMIPGQLRSFMKDMKTATESGIAAWSTTPFDGFVCERGKFSFSIWRFTEQDSGSETFGFGISDGSGGTKFLVNEHEGDFFDMGNIYATISASAHGFPEKLKNIFAP